MLLRWLIVTITQFISSCSSLMEGQFNFSHSLPLKQETKIQGGYSQNFLHNFVKISVTLGLNILSFLRLKSAF